MHTRMLTAALTALALLTVALPSKAAYWVPPVANIMLQPLGGSAEPWGVLNQRTGAWLPGAELDIPGANAYAGATLDSYADDGCDCQLWAPIVDPVQSAKAGYSVTSLMSISAYYPGFEELCLTATSTTTVQLEPCWIVNPSHGDDINPVLTQMWYWQVEVVPCPQCTVPNSPVYVTEMINYGNGRCLTVQNDSTANGALIVLAPCNGGASQIAWVPMECTASDDGIPFGLCSFIPGFETN